MLPACAHVFSLASRRDLAIPIAREYLEALSGSVGMQFAVINLPRFASAALRLDLADDLIDALADKLETPWTASARAYVQRDFVGAAEILHRTGSKPEEADARVRASEQLLAEDRRAEADEELRQALAFYHSVGATLYARECQALLHATAG